MQSDAPAHKGEERSDKSERIDYRHDAGYDDEHRKHEVEYPYPESETAERDQLVELKCPHDEQHAAEKEKEQCCEQIVECEQQYAANDRNESHRRHGHFAGNGFHDGNEAHDYQEDTGTDQKPLQYAVVVAQQKKTTHER